MPIRTLLRHLAAGRLARVQALTGAAAHRVLGLLLRTAPLPPLPDLVSLARWSRAHFRAPLPLPLHGLLLARLASHGLHPLLRSEFHALAAACLHSPASIIRALPASSSPTAAAPLVADMLVLALARASQPLAAYEAFLLAGDGHPRHRPSALSVNALLAALVRAERVDLVERAFRAALRRRVSPDLFTFNTVISGLCKAGQLRKAGDVAKDIRAWGLAPSVVTYNALIDGYCKRGRAGKMYHVDMLLKEMVEAGISPDVITFNVLVNWYCKDSNTAAAVRVFEEMKQQGIAANVATYTSLVWGLCSEGKVEEGVKLVDEMEGLELAPNVATLNSVLNGFCKKGMMTDHHHDLRSPACFLPRQLLCSAGERAAATAGEIPATWLLVTRETEIECKCFSNQHARSVLVEMPLRHVLLQARRCSSQPPPRLSVLLHTFRSFSIPPSGASAVPSRRSPVQIQLPQTLPCSDANPLGAGFHIDIVDSDLWPASFGFSSDAAPGDECPDGFQEHDEEEDMHDFDDEIDDMRHRKKLFYKLDRGSKEFEESNLPLRRRWKRDNANAKNPSECKKVKPDKSTPLKVPKLKAKPAVRKDNMVEAKRERVPSFNQMTDPYHHPFCLDIHVSKGSVRACFVHRVTSRVVSVAHSISKDMKFDLGSRKGIKACVAVGALLAKRAIEDDIHNAVYKPRKGDKIEGKIEIVLRGIIENGVDVKVKLKQRKPTKNTPVVHHDQSR